MREPKSTHVGFDQYLLVLRGELPIGALLSFAHAHLLDLCRVCARNWTGGVAFPVLEEGDFEDEDRTSGADVEAAIARQSTLRKLYREALEDVSRLLPLSQEERIRTVEKARTRFRTRAFAQRLIAEARERVKEEPELARDLAELVPLALRWAKHPWAAALVALSRAHHGNALRVAGDTGRAALLFSRLRADLRERSWQCSETLGEITSFYASLLTEQKRFSEADRALEQAAALFEDARDLEGTVLVLIQRANLAGITGDRLLSFHLHAEAASRMDKERSPYLHLTTVTGRVLSLAELGRADEAHRLLARHQSSYETHGGRYGAALWKCLRGRVYLAEEELPQAAASLEAGRDGLVELGRNQDAAMASLDLAAVYAKAGNLGALRRLATELVEVFSSLGVERELLATLAVLAQARRADASHLVQIRELRQRLERSAVVE